MDSLEDRTAQIKRAAAMFASLDDENQVLAALGLGLLACQRTKQTFSSVERFRVESFEQLNDVPGAGIDFQIVVLDLPGRDTKLDDIQI